MNCMCFVMAESTKKREIFQGVVGRIAINMVYVQRFTLTATDAT
jgi:hypothetical protein